MSPPSSSQFQIIAWEVITLEELYPQMKVIHIMNGVLNRQMRPPLANMGGKFRPLCEVRLCFCSSFRYECVSPGLLFSASLTFSLSLSSAFAGLVEAESSRAHLACGCSEVDRELVVTECSDECSVNCRDDLVFD